ncbi:hypothetical protein PQR02_11790 [Paraburkholderia sediminicola]|uniref:Uncharacterized protein n=1 Tax=Paraburkholderia rhynchosiae TaxID=487049 RepID=A0ACC7N716_9BURK
MKSSISILQTPAATAEDRSVCLEWQGLIHQQSYDSVDSLLHEVTHAALAQSTGPTATVEIAVVGQSDGLLPLGHYLL